MVMMVIINIVLMMLTMSMLIVVQSHYDTIVLSLHALTVRPSTGSVRPSRAGSVRPVRSIFPGFIL